MTLPWHLSPADDNSIKIDPVDELRALRFDETTVDELTVHAGEEKVIEELCSDCMEVKLTILTADAGELGIKLLCSPDSEEQTVITYDRSAQVFVIDFTRASSDTSLDYPKPIDSRIPRLKQIVPYPLKNGGELHLDIFVDRSIIEIFVDSRICLVQRVYPTREDSRQFRLFSRDAPIIVKDIVRWRMDATNPW